MMSILNLADRTEKRRVSVNVARVVGREPTVMRRRAMSGVTEVRGRDDAMSEKDRFGRLFGCVGVHVDVHGCNRAPRLFPNMPSSFNGFVRRAPICRLRPSAHHVTRQSRVLSRRMPANFSGTWKCEAVGDTGDFGDFLKLISVPWFIRKIAKFDRYGAGKEVETISMESAQHFRAVNNGPRKVCVPRFAALPSVPPTSDT